MGLAASRTSPEAVWMRSKQYTRLVTNTSPKLKREWGGWCRPFPPSRLQEEAEEDEEEEEDEEAEEEEEAKKAGGESTALTSSSLITSTVVKLCGDVW